MTDAQKPAPLSEDELRAIDEREVHAMELDMPAHETMRLIATVRERESSLEFTRQWYAERFERLRTWADELPENKRHEYFSIVANGTANILEPPTHAQLLNHAKHRAEAAEEKMRAQQAEIERLRAALTCIATPRASVDMADPDADQQRDALHALAMCRDAARTALSEIGQMYATAPAKPLKWERVGDEEWAYAGELLHLCSGNDGRWQVWMRTEDEIDPRVSGGSQSREAAKAAAVAAARKLLTEALAELGGQEAG